MDEYIKTVQQIRATLEKVRAEGAENWERLLACAQALEQLADRMQREGRTE